MLIGPANTAAGVRLLPPSALPSASHPYVFRQFPGLPPEDQSADDSHILVTQLPQTLPFYLEISADKNGLFSVSLRVPGGTAAGTYPLIFDPTETFLSSGASTELVRWVAGPPGGVTVVPEPAVAATCLLALPLLGRRRPNGNDRAEAPRA